MVAESWQINGVLVAFGHDCHCPDSSNIVACELAPCDLHEHIQGRHQQNRGGGHSNVIPFVYSMNGPNNLHIVFNALRTRMKHKNQGCTVVSGVHPHGKLFKNNVELEEYN